MLPKYRRVRSQKKPDLLKHRLVLALLYGCRLRRQELCNIIIQDADLDRKMVHIREGKGRKYLYVPPGDNLSRGIKTYIEAEQPYVWLFNGKTNLLYGFRFPADFRRFPSSLKSNANPSNNPTETSVVIPHMASWL
jgi:integrase